METKNTIELTDENVYPDNEVLQSALGEAFSSYLALLKLFETHELVHEWRYYRDGKAWLCKVQRKKKTIVWMSVWKGYLQATVYFPLRLLDKILELDLPDSIKANIEITKNVGKSKPCTFEIRNEEILQELEKVMALKIISK